MKDFFISYTKADQAWAEWIAWQLEHTQPPYTTIVQAWDFRPGTNFIQSMTNAAENSSRTIAVFSEDYFASNYTWSEWEAAFRQDPKGEKGILLPVRVKQCNIPKFLASLVFIDVVGKPETDATAELLKGVKTGRATPAVAPPFPGAAAAAPAVAVAPSATPKPEFPGIERYDVFMTYVDAESELVEEIARDLQSETLRVWRDRWIVTGPGHPARCRSGASAFELCGHLSGRADA